MEGYGDEKGRDGQGQMSTSGGAGKVGAVAGEKFIIDANCRSDSARHSFEAFNWADQNRSILTHHGKST